MDGGARGESGVLIEVARRCTICGRARRGTAEPDSLFLVAASFEHLRTISREAIDAGVVPGLAIAVGQGGQTPFLAAFGHRQVDPRVLPATEDTLWDLASLTKALCTSVLCMHAVGEGKASLSEPFEPPAA